MKRAVRLTRVPQRNHLPYDAAMRTILILLATALPCSTARAQLTLAPLPPIDVTALGGELVSGMTIDPGTGHLWVASGDANSPASSISEIDPATGAVVSTFETDSALPALQGGPDAMALDPATGNISLFSTFTRDVAGLVTQGGSFVASYPSALRAVGATFDSMGRLRIIKDIPPDSIAEVDPLTGAELGTLPLINFPGRPTALISDPITGNLFALTDPIERLVELDPNTGAMLSETDLSSIFGSSAFPGGATFSPDGSRLYFAKGIGMPFTEILVFERIETGIAITCQPANPHSSGGPVTLAASDFSGPGVVHLEAAEGPPGEFAYFLVSSQLVDPGMPLAGGVLCLGSPIARYSPGSGAAQFNSTGQFNSSGILQNLVGTSTVPTGFDVPMALPGPIGGTVTTGSTFHFQLWFRDGQTSNFSDAASVTFP